MKIKWYLLSAGRLQEQPILEGNLLISHGELGESWFDVQDTDPEELRKFLTPLDLHPLQLTRCFDSVNDPGLISFGNSLLMEFPATFERESADPSYLTILLQDHVLVTIRHGEVGALDDLVSSLTGETLLPVLHLPQIIYMILDQFADLNVEAQVSIRDQILLMSAKLYFNHIPSCDRRYRLLSECLFGLIAASMPRQTAPLVQTLTTDLIIGLHANQPHTDLAFAPIFWHNYTDDRRYQ